MGFNIKYIDLMHHLFRIDRGADLEHTFVGLSLRFEGYFVYE